MSEYELLRNEIIENHNAIKDYNIALYATVSLVLTITLGEGFDWWYNLIPYVAIVPLYFACEGKNRNICKIASYMYVFLEGQEYNWERRHHKYDVENSAKRNWKSIFQYYFTSAICSAITIIKIITCCKSKFIPLFSVLLGTLLVFFAMVVNTVNYVKYREKMIKKWDRIKLQEIQCKKEFIKCGRAQCKLCRINKSKTI